MNLDLLLPFAGTHSVQSVALVAEWQGELSDQTLLGIHSFKDEFKEYFPVVDLQRMMQFSVTPTEATTKPLSALGGVVFQQMSKLGAVARHFQVTRQNSVFLVNDYTRWNPTLDVVMKYFTRVFPKILADKAITAIALQYTDSFTWKDDPDSLDLKEVFRTGSPYLPANVFEMKDPWHAHHGFMQKVSDPIDGERLDNININVADVSGERKIDIVCSHRISLAKPLRLSTTDYMHVVSAVANAMHTRNKELLADVLSDGVINKIQLKK